MPVYFAAHIVSNNSQKILQCECEMPYVYKCLLTSAQQPHLPLEHLISQTCAFFVQFPPSSLATEAAEYRENLAVSTFHDYRLVALQENPEDKLNRLKREQDDKLLPVRDEGRRVSPRWGRLRSIGIATGGIVGTIALAATGVLVENAPTIANYLFGWKSLDLVCWLWNL